MKYMVTTHGRGNHLSHLGAKTLKAFKARIEKGKSDGSIDGAYAMVGGGSVWIVNSSSNDSLYKVLRQMGVHGVDVVPLIDAVSMIDHHIATTKKP